MELYFRLSVKATVYTILPGEFTDLFSVKKLKILKYVNSQKIKYG